MSETNKPNPNRLENTATTVIAGIALAKAAKVVLAPHVEKVIEQYKERKSGRVTPAIAEPTPEATKPQGRQLSERELQQQQKAQRRLGETASYINSFFRTPMSLRKVLPRDGGTYHAPWSYHHAPSYGSLWMDQTPDITKNGDEVPKYPRPVDFLIKAGEKPLRDAVARQHQEVSEDGWVTLLSSEMMKSLQAQSTTEAKANNARRLVVGALCAVEGMGLDSSDLAFTSWEKNGDRFVAVPYDKDNLLHQVAVAGSGADTMERPGIVARYAGNNRSGEISLSIKPVDLSELQSEYPMAEWDSIPNPSELAHAGYKAPNVLPSTGVPL